MYVCMYVYVYVYVYAYVCVYIYMYIYIHTHIWKPIPVAGPRSRMLRDDATPVLPRVHTAIRYNAILFYTTTRRYTML